MPLQLERGDPVRRVSMQAEGSSTNCPRSRRERTGVTSTDTAADPTASIDLFDKARNHERLEQLQAAREHDLLPYFRLLEGPAGPVVEMEGARADHARLQQLPRADRRPERVKARPRRARPLRHRPDRLALPQRHAAAAPRARARARRLVGRPRTRWSSRPATWPTPARSPRCSDPGDTVICDSGDHASILDAVSMSRARVRPFRHGRLDKLEKMLDARPGRRRRRAGGGRRRVLDGGRPGRPCRTSRALCREHGARLMVDEAHGVGVLGERGTGRLRAARRRGRGRPAHGHLLQVARLLRRLHRRPGRRDRLPARPVALVHVHRLGGAGGGGRRPGRAADHPLARGRRADGHGARQRRATCTRAWRRSASRCWSPTSCPTAQPDHPDRAGGDRRRLAGRADLEGALRRRRLRERGALPGGPRAAGRCCAPASWRPTSASTSTARWRSSSGSRARSRR